MILPKIRDKRFITVRRGGVLLDEDHYLLAVWAAQCAEHVLHYFEEARPDDDRPRRAIELTHAWVNREIIVRQALDAAGASNASARELSGASKFAALSAGQAAAVAHVAAHELGAAATLSGPLWLPPQKIKRILSDMRNVDGSGTGFRKKFEIW